MNAKDALAGIARAYTSLSKIQGRRLAFISAAEIGIEIALRHPEYAQAIVDDFHAFMHSAKADVGNQDEFIDALVSEFPITGPSEVSA